MDDVTRIKLLESKIYGLERQFETEVNDLKKQLERANDKIEQLSKNNDVTAQHFVPKTVVKSAFDYNVFCLNKTVEYLKAYKLTHDDLSKLLNNIKSLDFSCVKYLIDCYDQGIYDRNEKFVHSDLELLPIHYICQNGTPEAVFHLLDVYVKNNWDLECETSNKWKPIHFICRYQNSELVSRILDIYLEKKL